MKLSGSQTIPAARSVVWAGLNDPSILKQCIPGCESIDATGPNNFTAKVVAKIGPVRASFTGAVTLSDIVAPVSYRISGQGQGGLAGFASGGASVKLTETGPTDTLMEYDVDAQIGGKMAMLGSRLIDSSAQSLAGQFFDKFAALMKAQAKAAPTVAAAASKVGSQKKPAGKAKSKSKPVAKSKPIAKKSAKKSLTKKAVGKKKTPAKKSAVKKSLKKKGKR
jgi:uncharacterized protein